LAFVIRITTLHDTINYNHKAINAAALSSLSFLSICC
jgi:hypothetical protein